MDPRPGFMLFGSLIIPGPIEPPEPPQLLRLFPSPSQVNPNNPNPAGKEKTHKLIRRLVIKLNGQLLYPADSVPKPNPGNQQDRNSAIELKPEREPLTPELRRLLGSMGVAEDHTPIHFFTRSLYPSDVKKGLTRLTIPKSQLLRPFLTDQEEALLPRKRLQVHVVDPSLVVRTLSLSRWNYKKSAKQPASSWSYALNGGWMDVVDCNGLTARDTIQVWSFRKTDASLGFIIFKEHKGISTAPASANGDGNPVVSVNQGSSCSDKDNNGRTPATWGKKRKRGSSSSLSTLTTA